MQIIDGLGLAISGLTLRGVLGFKIGLGFALRGGLGCRQILRSEVSAHIARPPGAEQHRAHNDGGDVHDA